MPPSLFHLNMNIKEVYLYFYPVSILDLGLTLLNVRYQGLVTCLKLVGKILECIYNFLIIQQSSPVKTSENKRCSYFWSWWKFVDYFKTKLEITAFARHIWERYGQNIRKLCSKKPNLIYRLHLLSNAN